MTVTLPWPRCSVPTLAWVGRAATQASLLGRLNTAIFGQGLTEHDTAREITVMLPRSRSI